MTEEQRFEDVRWTWKRDLPLRYLLIDEEWDGEQTLWARCADVEGLFVDRAPHRERLTLVGCVPDGRLRKAVDGAERERDNLGDLSLHVYDDEEDRNAVHYWDLDGAVVVGSRPGESGPDRIDVVIEAEVTGPPGPAGSRRAPGTEPEWAEVCVYNGTGGMIGTCRRVDGLYADRPKPSAGPPLTLVGCEPSERLLRRLTRPRVGGDPVELWALDRTGRVFHVLENLYLDIGEARPSALGGALIDVTFGKRIVPALSAAGRPAWDAWYEGAPREPNEWARLTPEARAEWQRFTTPGLGDGHVGGTCHLDGRFATDIAGLWCALGEAIGGPGASFGVCRGLLQGCSCGGDRMPGPFTLVWHHADIARRSLSSVSVDREGELSYFESVLWLLEHSGITVELR
ncbi:barstar family protein [Streptomyces altiplanensis]